MTTWLRAEVDRSFRPPWNAVTEHAVFGPLDPDEIVDAIDGACAAALGAGLSDGFLYKVSVGVVVGCELVDGRRVVLKAYQPRWSDAFLGAVKRVQRELHLGGFACPLPLDGDLRVGRARVLAESAVDDPGLAARSAATRTAGRCPTCGSPAGGCTSPTTGTASPSSPRSRPSPSVRPRGARPASPAIPRRPSTTSSGTSRPTRTPAARG